MLNTTIKYLNSKIQDLKYFNVILELVDRIERDGQIFPAIYSGNGEYKAINLDAYGSLGYWRLNGEISQSQQENTTGIGQDYIYDIPLKFIGFRKKDSENDDQYLSQKLANGVISSVTSQTAYLANELNAKRLNISATKFNTDSREVEKSEYENKTDYKQDKIRFTQSYFSIDISLKVVTKSNCLQGLCSNC